MSKSRITQQGRSLHTIEGGRKTIKEKGAKLGKGKNKKMKQIKLF